jgi:hypothetical protein
LDDCGVLGFVFPNALKEDFWLWLVELDVVDPGGDQGANGFCFSVACDLLLSNVLCDSLSLACDNAPDVELPLTELLLCELCLVKLEDDSPSLAAADAPDDAAVVELGFQGLKGLEVSGAFGLFPPPKALYEVFSCRNVDESRESEL